MNNNIRQGKRLIFVKIFLNLGCIMMFAISASASETAAVDLSKTTITMKNERGQTRKFSQAEALEIAAIFQTPVNDENHFILRARESDCRRVEKSVELQAGYLIELPFIIDSLNDSQIPLLSGSQKETLSRVPLCQPYLLELKIIALQLNGWKLEKRESVDERGNAKAPSS